MLIGRAWQQPGLLPFGSAAFRRFPIPGAGCSRFSRRIHTNNVIERRSNLLGSADVKVGEWYAGMDDFSYLAPTFETDLEYRHYKGGAEDARFEGSFEEAFIDLALLDDPDYYNKYNAFLHGVYIESVIVNRSAPNGLKCLLVAHSYGRPMAQYLSLAFAETRYLDPQKGRFEGDIAAYVRDWKPDVVIVMYNNTFNVG